MKNLWDKFKALDLKYKFIIGAVTLLLVFVLGTFVSNRYSDIKGYIFDRGITQSDAKIEKIMQDNALLLAKNEQLIGQNEQLKKERLELDSVLLILKNKTSLTESQIEKEKDKLKDTIEKIESESEEIGKIDNNKELCEALNSLYGHKLPCDKY